jgi:Family of unknown function (DUF6152)
MSSQSTAILAAVALTAATGVAAAHHSFAMFDTEHPIEISGIVKEFKFVAPHSILIIEVKGEDGVAREWTLESVGPGLLIRAGLNARSFKPGDPFKGTISPLHSGALGGSYFPPQVNLNNPGPAAAPQ